MVDAIPTLGRIVLFTDMSGLVAPAIVSHVHEAKSASEVPDVDLTYFASAAPPRPMTRVPFGKAKARGCWCWPSRD